MSLQCQDRISTYEVKLCWQHNKKHFRVFSDSLSHVILIHVHAYVSLFPGIETNIASRIKTFPWTSSQKIESLFENKTNVSLKLQHGLWLLYNIIVWDKTVDRLASFVFLPDHWQSYIFNSSNISVKRERIILYCNYVY